MTPHLRTLHTTHPTRTPHRPPQGGLRRELHGAGGSGVQGERDPGDKRGEAGGRASHAELPNLSRMLTRPALLNCWGQNRSDRWGRCDPGHQQLQPDSPTVYTANLPGQLQPLGQLQSPRAPSSCWGAMPATPSRAPHSQLSGEFSELREIMSIQGVWQAALGWDQLEVATGRASFSVSLLLLKRPPSLIRSCLALSRRPPKYSQAAGRGFRAEQDLQCLMVSRAGHNSPSTLREHSPSTLREHHCGSETDPLKAQPIAPGSHRGLRT